EIHEVILSVSGVLTVDDLKVRRHMTQKYVDVEIGVQSSLTLEKSHKIAENVHHKVEKAFPEVLHCMVHVNPHKL
ncbi:MAG: cation transporter, partial [Candidatus Margulisbacteria bacterium]|nr:cation transporter [Candidatus Margulisiibacteriota bacterium]